MNVDANDAYRKMMKEVLTRNNFHYDDYDRILEEKEVLQLNNHFKTKKRTLNSQRIHSIIDYETNRFLVLSKWASTIIALRSTLNSCPKFNIKIPTAPNFDAANCWMYTSNNWMSTIVPSQFPVLTNLTVDKVYKFLLLQRKTNSLDAINDFISIERMSINKDLPYQSFIYQEKYSEAKQIIDNNISTDLDMNYPFVSSYAKLRDISLIDAAKDIVFQYKNIIYRNCESEEIRIKYSRLIIEETDLDKFPIIMDEFNKESQVYANL